MFKIDFIALLAIFGIVQGLFVASLFWLRKNRNLHNSFFSLLLFATSIRIAKNIIVHLTSIDGGLKIDPQLWRFAVNFGISHQFAIGPLFLFYFKTRINTKYKLSPAITFHFLAYAILTLFSAVIPWAFWRDGGLWFSYSHILVYYLLAVHVYFKAFRHHMVTGNGEVDMSVFKWLRTLLVITAILMIAYSPSLFKYVGYIGGASLYAIGIYVVSWMALRDRKLNQSERYATSPLSSEQSKQISEDLHELMQSESLYLDEKLSMSKLAARLNVRSNYLSQAINQQFNCSYADYINGLRLAAVKERLLDPQFAHLKIAAIAYDCGFESISLFNTVFKRSTGSTPSQWRDQELKTKSL